MRENVAQFITQRWYIIVLFWLGLAVALRILGPSWDSVVKDGDFQFLPADSPSRVGQATLRKVFPGDLAKSQMVVVFAKPDGQWTAADRCTMYDVARRLSYSVADINFRRWVKASSQESGAESAATQRLLHNFDAAVQFDEKWFTSLRELEGSNTSSLLGTRRLIDAYLSRQQLAQRIGNEELVNSDRRTVEALLETYKQSPAKISTIPQSLEPSIEEIWTWQDPVLAKNLGEEAKEIKLLSLQLREEFMAVRNIQLMESLQSIVNECRELTRLAAEEARLAKGEQANVSTESELQIHITGPAAVGADLMTAAKTGVRQSEIYAIISVLLTLVLIYRSPLLVFLPLITIALALSVSTNVLAILANLSIQSTQTPWVELYSTTRVFLVVLIFGIGTDLCLFLIVRCRENFLSSSQVVYWHSHIANSWQSVLGAIAGSGLTTTVGLSMMAFSTFAKFKYSGISIAIAVLITLAVCITLPAAILAAIGPAAYWPRRRHLVSELSGSSSEDKIVNSDHLSQRVWNSLANTITRRPTFTLVGTLLLLLAPSLYGWMMMDRVTYNLVGELSENATSRQGQRLVNQYLPNTETSSISLVATAKYPFADEADFRKAIEAYRKQLFVDGVISVQSLTDPLGEFPPDRNMSLLSQGAWRRRLLQNHPLTQQKFVSNVDTYVLRAARFEIVMNVNPFSNEAAEVLAKLQERTKALSADPTLSQWYKSDATFTGTTAGIIDLKTTTQTDEKRVQLLVTLGVLGVLLLLIRRWELSFYLMFTVLLSYFATLGVSQAIFQWLYGASFEGIDWKVPLFLFVILVAVGQDYNIYLVTSILEQQKMHGTEEGLKRAIVTTGGIISSCGLIMFATFASMCIGSVQSQFEGVMPNGWPAPALRGISELGFALSFGVLLDTFLIRTIVVPAYISFRKLN